MGSQIQFHYTKGFQKMLLKLPKPIQDHLWIRLDLFQTDQFHRLLNNHPLSGEYEGCRSINVTGDYRCVFSIQNSFVTLVNIGTHAQLYE